MRGTLESAARPGGARATACRHLDAIAEVAKGAKILAIDLCILLQIFFGGVLVPPCSPSRSPAHSAGLPQKLRSDGPCCDQNFDHIFDIDFGSILGRLGMPS